MHLNSQHTRNEEMDEKTSHNTPIEVQNSHGFQEALVAWNDCTRLTTNSVLATGRTKCSLPWDEPSSQRQDGSGKTFRTSECKHLIGVLVISG